MIIGLFLGQMIEQKSDRDIVTYFHENLYFQYFCGCDSFASSANGQIIHPSLLSKRRRRLGKTFANELQRLVIEQLKSKGIDHAFPSIGRPPNIPPDQKTKQRQQFLHKQRQRNHIEAVFGHLKDRFNLGKIKWHTTDGHLLQVQFGLAAFNLHSALSKI